MKEIISEIGQSEVAQFVRNGLIGHEHIAFLYSGKTEKNNILSQFFDPSASPYTLRAIISLSSNSARKYQKVKSITYDEFLIVEKSKAMSGMFEWISEIHKSNLSGRETRVAGEDASWFLRNGFDNEFLDAEKKIGRRVQDKISVLCAYDTERIPLESQLKRIIESHGYVIIDRPMEVYKAPKS